MNIDIISQPLELSIYGYSSTAMNKDYAGTAFKLMDKMWQVVKSNNLPNKGKNIWVYDTHHAVFAGVELEDNAANSLLENKRLTLHKYAYYKHIGPYHLIKQSGSMMNEEINKRGLETSLPYIEIYGHWTNDETKLETELLMSIK